MFAREPVNTCVMSIILCAHNYRKRRELYLDQSTMGHRQMPIKLFETVHVYPYGFVATSLQTSLR